jgi:hypothetical protein
MPDIQTPEQYAEYQQTIKEFIAGNELSFLSTGTWDYEHDGDTRPENWSDEPWFSWRVCECCQSHLGGNREYLYARDAHGDCVQFTICEDCVYYVNYGRLDDMTMQRIGQ